MTARSSPGRLYLLRAVRRMRRLVSIASAAALLVAAVTAAQASDDSWPQRPIRLIVPFPAGASTDVVSRVIGQRLSQDLGQQIVIENRAGASGNIGAANHMCS